MIMSNEDMDLHLKMADFCIGLGRGDQIKFANIMSMVPSFNGISLNKKENGIIPRIPICYNDIRRWYIRGKNSIYENLPHPKVIQWKGHSYISLKQCIAHHLAHGLSVLEIEDDYTPIVTCIGNSKRAVDMKKRAYLINKEYDEEIVPILLNRWSDDFDPNNTKKNRGSIWVFTITIIPYHEKQGKLIYTYPIYRSQVT